MKEIMLKLPDVTLVMVETREHALARLSIEDSVRNIQFGDVLICTDRPLEFSPLSHVCDYRIHVIEDFPSKVGWAQFMWDGVPPLLRTAFSLQTQWDSWVFDIGMWKDEFLRWDFTGSPWWYKDGMNVGNSGFSLTSTALKRFLRKNAWDFPCSTDVEDDLLCRKYRPKLQELGFTWAPERLAHEFAFECYRPSPTSRHFGFHGSFNFGDVLSPERLKERVRLMLASPYIANPNGYIWKAISQKYPAVIEEVLAEKTLAATAG